MNGDDICRAVSSDILGVQEVCERAFKHYQQRRHAIQVKRIRQACQEHRFRDVLHSVLQDYPSWKQSPINLSDVGSDEQDYDDDDANFLKLPLEDNIARQFLTAGPNKEERQKYPIIFRAIREDNIGIVCLLVHRREKGTERKPQSYFWYDKSNSQSLTPLAQASALGRSDIVGLLIEAGAKVDELAQMRFDNSNSSSSVNSSAVITPLVASVVWSSKESYATTKILIEQGRADVNAMSLFREKRDTDSNEQHNIVLPLGVACQYGRYKAAKLLIENGSDINLSRPDSWPPLHMSSYHGYSKIVDLLLENGAGINLLASSTTDETGGVTPVYLAAEGGHLKIARKLVRAGADINTQRSDGVSPLTSATVHGRDDMAIYLIKSGADIYHTDPHNWTALHVAVYHSKIRIARILLKKKVNPNSLTNDQENTLMVCALAPKADDDHISMARMLLRAGAFIDQENGNGVTPLIAAAWSGNSKLVKLLLSKGADVNHTESEGNFSALHSAAFHGHTEIVKMLLRYNACLDCGSIMNVTALSLACEKEHVGVVQVLLNNNASLYQAGLGGMPPLAAVAAFTENTNLTRLLVEHESSLGNNTTDLLDEQDFAGRTALYHASDRSLNEMVQALLEYGSDPNIANIDEWTPLKIAKYHKNKELEELLERHGGRDNWTKKSMLQSLMFSFPFFVAYLYFFPPRRPRIRI